MRDRKPARGFSTLELLITMALLALLVTQILGVIGSQQNNLTVHQDVLEAQGDARLVSDLMLSDVRMAGFMVPKYVGISSVDGGVNGSDSVCVSDYTGIDLAMVAGVGDRFDGARISSAVGSGDTTLHIVPADLDIDGNGSNDFSVGSGVIVSDGTRSHCARITAIDAATGAIDITPPTPGGFAAGTAFTRAVPAIIYEVGAGGLVRNGVAMAKQVEDVQVQFVVNGTVVNSLDGQPTDKVETVRLSVVTRTDRDDLNKVPGQLPAVANRVAGPADSFRRRVLTNTIAPRNFL